MMKKILIYDDDKRLRSRLERRLRSARILDSSFEIDSLDDEAFLTSMEVLAERRRAFRKTGTWTSETRAPLDDAAILIIDYDLFDTDDYLTAETVAYYARCFSTCGLFVGVNQYGHNTFDLTLKGHPESFADLNVGQEQLNNPNLWGGTATGFHPSYWPVLPSYLDDFEKKVKDINASLREDILIDAPHLVSRYPSLLSGDVEDIQTWDRIARPVSHDELGLSEVIKQFRLAKGYWLSRPVWFWDKLRECEEIVEVEEPWKIKRPAWVFCEDASEFNSKGYREFVADVESPFARRFVGDFKRVAYRPGYRFYL